MKNFDESSSFYHEAINLIDLNDHQSAIKSIKKNIHTLKKMLEQIFLLQISKGLNLVYWLKKILLIDSLHINSFTMLTIEKSKK